MSLDKVKEWFSEKNTSFLIGAGCSACAGKPLIGELTQQVLQELPQNIQDIISSIKGNNGRKATIEDLLNYLIKQTSLLEAHQDDDFTFIEGLKKADLESAIIQIQHEIAKKIGGEWKSSEKHKEFLLKLHALGYSSPIDIFLLNYDTVLESSIEELGLPYTDGFIGADNAFFALEQFISPHDKKYKSPFRIYKLHGSINWVKDQNEVVRRIPLGATPDESKVMIYPCEQKYVQTQFGVYEILMKEFRERLRLQTRNNQLIVLGYSFNDEHINVVIEDAIQANRNLTVFGFVGGEKHGADEIKRFEQFEKKCDDRLNILLGNTKFIGKGLEPEEFEEIKDAELWKFENLVNLLVGK